MMCFTRNTCHFLLFHSVASPADKTSWTSLPLSWSDLIQPDPSELLSAETAYVEGAHFTLCKMGQSVDICLLGDISACACVCVQGPTNRHLCLGSVPVHFCFWPHPLQRSLSLQALPGGAARAPQVSTAPPGLSRTAGSVVADAYQGQSCLFL